MTLQQFSQFLDFLAREPLALDEMREHRLKRTSEHPLKKGLARGLGAFAPLNQGMVEVCAPVYYVTPRAFFGTNRVRNALTVLGCQEPSRLRAAMIWLAEQGDCSQMTFITSHSVSDMRGIFFILWSSRLRLQSFLDYIRNQICQWKF